jgi:hypothetical protein
MPRPRSADPLTAATTALLLPFLRPHGFKRKSNRLIVRITDGVAQFVHIHLSCWGGKDFRVHYVALPLFCPRDYLILQPGDTLNRENGAEAWFPAQTHELAGASMETVVRMLHEQALPFFDATRTVQGLLGCLRRERWGSDHHLNMEKGCCLARLHQLDEAQERLHRAIDLYREDGRDWCEGFIQQCECLLVSIRAGRADEQLREWTRHSVTALGFQSLVSEDMLEEF